MDKPTNQPATKTQAVVDEATKTEKVPMTSVPTAEFNAILKRVESLEQSKRPSEDDMPVIGGVDEEREFTTRVKTYKGRPVIRIKDTESKGKDAQGLPIMECTIITIEKDGKETEHEKADYLAITKAPAEVCRIIDVKDKPITKPGPVVTVKVWNDKKESEIRTGKRVRAAVNFLERTYTVEWKGETYKTQEINVPN